MKLCNFLIIFIFIPLIFMIGCKAEISNNDNWPEYREKYLGKKFVIKANYFLVEFHDDIIKELMIEIPGDISGFSRIPTQKQFRDNPTDTYVSGVSKIVSLGGQGTSFEIIHVMDYYLNPSYSFTYLIVESLENKQQFVMRRAAYSLGVKGGYIQIVE